MFDKINLGTVRENSVIFAVVFFPVFFIGCVVLPETEENWYFVTKIVLTYCEKKMFAIKGNEII